MGEGLAGIEGERPYLGATFRSAERRGSARLTQNTFDSVFKECMTDSSVI